MVGTQETGGLGVHGGTAKGKGKGNGGHKEQGGSGTSGHIARGAGNRGHWGQVDIAKKGPQGTGGGTGENSRAEETGGHS